ncbi:MAG TPA: LysR family transcriptional regulator [Acetobacteraceae bacterium]|nr:LysR family transcriptional regulator [Acetobacteraceae bacterium]
MPRQLPLSALRAFEAVTRTGSFRAAADDLNLTASAVSHAIRGLEVVLGATLFLREGRSIRLTEEGEMLALHTERGFGELQLGISNVSSRGRPQLLRLHCAPSLAAQWLLPRLRRLLSEVRGLEVRISAGTDYTRFAADDFDADIVYGAPPPGFYSGAPGLQGMETVPLGTEVVTPLCSPELAPVIRSPRDLYAQTLIESDNKKVRWTDWFAINRLTAPESRGPRFDRSFLSISAAMDGLGVALESTRLAERELASGRLVRPLEGACEDVAYTGHWLVFPRTKRYSRPLMLFSTWIAKELGLETDLFALEGADPKARSAQTQPMSRAMGKPPSPVKLTSAPTTSSQAGRALRKS